jgi:hypothetical protein
MTTEPITTTKEHTIHPPTAYLQALPGQSAVLDLTKLDLTDTNFAYIWLSQLLKSGAAQQSFRADFSVSETLQRLYFSIRNHERVSGLPLLGFGYPLLVWSQGDDRLVAPLFLWQTSLAPAPETPGTWMLTHREIDAVQHNHSLVSFLQQSYGVAIEPPLNKVFKNGKINPEALVACCTEIAGMLGIENTSQHIALAECPTGAGLEKTWEQGAIQWSGILGCFPPLPARLEVALPAPESNDQGSSQKHEFGLLPLDPYQASALQAIFREQRVWVRGAAGTGKTHLLVHLLTNALSNGKRCLVVAENMGALRQVQKRLEQLGLLAYSFLLQDGVTEKPALLNALRNLASINTPTPNFDEAGFRVALDKYQRLKTKLDDNYQNLRQAIFGPYNWTETVGLFLRSNRVEGKELLTSHLHTQDFKFLYEEFAQLQEGIRYSQSFYRKINTLRHPLSNLHEAIFLQQSQTEGLHFVSQHLQTFLEKSQKLHHRYISKTNLYADQLAEQYEGIYGDFANHLMRLQDRIADFVTTYGADFEQAGAGALKLKGVFSGRYKSVLEARDEVATHYLALVRKFEKAAPFEFVFAPAAEGKNSQKVRQNLALFEKALLRWRDRFPALVQEEMQRLSARNARPELGLQEQMQELENGLDQLVEELNTLRLYQDLFANKMLTIPKRQKYLEEIIEQLENTRLYLREYHIFYDWQRHWLQQPDNAAKIIRALVKVKPNDWLQAFESWYLHQCLNLHANATLTFEEESVSEFVRRYEQLQQLLPGQIGHLYRERREEALKKLRNTNRAAFTLLFDKKSDVAKDKTLSELLAPTVEAVTTLFPILLATPHAVATALPAVAHSFDYVLIEEAQYLTGSVFAPLSALGRKAVLVEEAAQLPSLQASSLAAWASAQALPAVALQTCHRSNPANVLQSLNGTASADFALHFTQVEGRYEEATGTNQEEAQRIITLLNEVKPTAQRTFPTVGIVCFTIAQRDLIAAYLLKIKQKRAVGVEKIQQLERNGLGVFYVDELRGQHFDTLIVSGTYGIKNAKGEMTSHVAQLNTSAFLPHLQLLLSRALHTLFIANSIPQAVLQRWLQQPQHPGTYLFANYLNAGQNAVSEAKERVNRWLQTNPTDGQVPLFAQEAALGLQPYLGAERLKVGVLYGHLHLPLLITGAEGQPALLLQPDGFFGQTPATDYVWEKSQREAARAAGLEYQPIWSVQWWKNAPLEARKLAGSVIARSQ